MSHEATETDPAEVALAYHDRTKHHFMRLARSLGFMDWSTQPDPFRRFHGSELIPLPRPDKDDTPPYGSLYRPGTVEPGSVNLERLSRLFYYALALSAWKRHRTAQWALRVNPSSGNLHPTEGYLLSGPVAGLSDRPGVYHYAPTEHGLEHRATFDEEAWEWLTHTLPGGSVLVALSSIPWRESWKYGERAWRYCQHDAGHAIAAVRLSAALRGWRAVLLSGVSDERLGRLVGLDREEASHEDEEEVPDALLAMMPEGEAAAGVDARGFRLDAEAVDRIMGGNWFGQANQLSRSHHPWDVIDAVEIACRKPVEGWVDRSDPPLEPPAVNARLRTDACPHSAGRIIRQRRSAVAMDGATAIEAEQLHAMLMRTLPRQTAVPWDALSWRPLVDLALFVHRVRDVEPGLYVLLRDPARRTVLQREMREEFEWTRPPGTPENLPLYRLLRSPVRDAATTIGCHQDIAGDGAFSLGMIAAFEPVLRKWGAPWYRHLHWEAGMIGHVLYLEAEAAGVRSTGMGCFFDDAMHQALGLTNRRFQTIYHFTVGGAVEDERLTTLPAYS